MRGLKRTIFFWLEQLQINRSERIAITVLFGLILITSIANQFIRQRYNYNQEEYEKILAEFEIRSRALELEQIENEKKYLPQAEETTDAIEHVEVPITTTETKPQIAPEPPAEKPVPEIKVDVSDQMAATINVNTADLSALVRLPGIGPVYAQRILDYREEYGNFNTVEELLKIKGIGAKTLEKIRPLIEL